MTIRRSWGWAEEKRGPCRNCGTTRNIELAHVAGRQFDRTPPIGFDPADWPTGTLTVHPNRVISLCGPATDPTSCHGAQHNRRLDILPLRSLDEQLQAVADLGGIESARIRLAPSAYPERLAAA